MGSLLWRTGLRICSCAGKGVFQLSSQLCLNSSFKESVIELQACKDDGCCCSFGFFKAASDFPLSVSFLLVLPRRRCCVHVTSWCVWSKLYSKLIHSSLVKGMLNIQWVLICPRTQLWTLASMQSVMIPHQGLFGDFFLEGGVEALDLDYSHWSCLI